MWNDSTIQALNRGLDLPPIKIVPLHRSDRSGDTFLFTSYLSTQDSDWNNAIGYGTTGGLAGDHRRAQAAEGSWPRWTHCAVDARLCRATTGSATCPRAISKGLGEAELAERRR